MRIHNHFHRTGSAASILFVLFAVAAEAAPRTPAPTAAPITKSTTESSTQLGKQTKVRFRVGAEITASRGACRNILAMVTVPLECPEQQVTIVSEDFSPEVLEVTYRPLPGGE